MRTLFTMRVTCLSSSTNLSTMLTHSVQYVTEAEIAMTTIAGAAKSVSSPTVSAAKESEVKSTLSTGMQPSCSCMSHVSAVTKD